VKRGLRLAFAPSRLSSVDAGVSALLLIAVGALVFGAHVAHGGFWLDDWATAASYRFAPSPHYLNAAEGFRDYAGGRPLLALALPAPYAVFGLNTVLHHGLALALCILASWLFYVFMRLFRLAPAHAFAIAALSGVFPWTDSVRLWPTASINQLAVIFYLTGAIVALLALDASGTRAKLGHGVAVLLFLASILTYEAVAAVALVTGALYFLRTSARRALAYWAVDVVVLVGGLVYSLVATSGARGVGTADRIAANIPHFARDTVTLVPLALVPIDLPAPAKAVVVAIALAVVVLALREARRNRGSLLRAWLLAGIAAAVAVVGTYVMFLSKGPFPLAPGRENRVNVFAALPWSLAVYSVLALAAILASSYSRRVQWEPIVLLLAVVVGAGYVVKVRHDASLWERAADLQKPVLAAIRDLPPLPRGTTIYTFGHPTEVAPEIYVFAKVYDLDGAARIELHDSSADAYPIAHNVRLVCGRSMVVPTAPGTHFGQEQAARYGHLLFLDVRRRRWSMISSRNQCRVAARAFAQGAESGHVRR
jgi:hypothetical protein